MNLINTKDLTEKEQNSLISELKKIAKKRKNLASSEQLKVTITGRIVRGSLLDNCKVFAIDGIVDVEKKPADKKPAAKKPAAKKPAAKKPAAKKNS
jgi:hypothetical protein